MWHQFLFPRQLLLSASSVKALDGKRRRKKNKNILELHQPIIFRSEANCSMCGCAEIAIAAIEFCFRYSQSLAKSLFYA